MRLVQGYTVSPYLDAQSETEHNECLFSLLSAHVKSVV